MKQFLIISTLVYVIAAINPVLGWMGWPRHHHGSHNSHRHTRQDNSGSERGIDRPVLLSNETQASKEVKGYIQEKQVELKDRINHISGAKEIIGNVDALSFRKRTTNIHEKVADYEEYDLDYFYTGTHYFIKIRAKVKGGNIGEQNQEQIIYLHIRMFKSDGNNKVEIVGVDESPYVKKLKDPIKPFGIFDIFIENVRDPLGLKRLNDSGIIVDPNDSTKFIQRPKFNYD